MFLQTITYIAELRKAIYALIIFSKSIDRVYMNLFAESVNILISLLLEAIIDQAV